MSGLGYQLNYPQMDNNVLNYLMKQKTGGNNMVYGEPDSWMNRVFGGDSIMGNMSKGLQGIGGLYQAYNANKALKQAQQAFEYQRDLSNANLANQSKITNEQLDHQKRMRLSSEGIRGAEADARINAYMDKYGTVGTI